MQIERVKNTKRNIIFGFINKIVLLILPFFVRTIVLYKLGSEYLGVDSLFSSILHVLNLSELGFSSAVVYSLYKPIAENNEAVICALMAYYKRIYRKIGIFIGVAGLTVLPFLSLLIKGEYPSEINIYILYLIYLGNTVISYLFFAYKGALLNAHQRIDALSNIGTVAKGTMFLAQIAIILIIKNYYVYTIMLPVFTLINNAITAYIVKMWYPRYICSGQLPKEYVADIKLQVSGLMVNKICQTTRNSFDSIVLSATLGLVVTAIYSNYYYIMTAIIGIVAIICDSMLAGVGNSIVVETREKNYSDLKKINFVYMWIGGWCTVCLACLYQPFMVLWVGQDMMFDYSVVILFCLYFYILKMGDIRALYSDAAGLWWANRKRAIWESVANLVLNILFVQIWGVHGVIVATIFSLLVINFGFGSQIVFKEYFKNNKLGEYFGLHAQYALVTIMVTVVTYGICRYIILEGLIGLICKGILCVFVPNIIYFACYRKTKVYKEAIPWLLTILKRR